MTLFSDRLRCCAILLKSVNEVAEDAATALRIVELVDVLRRSLAEEFVQDVGVIFDRGFVLAFLDFEELFDGGLEGDAAVMEVVPDSISSRSTLAASKVWADSRCQSLLRWM